MKVMFDSGANLEVEMFLLKVIEALQMGLMACPGHVFWNLTWKNEHKSSKVI